MSSYTKSTDFASKDALLTGNPLKVVKGTEIDDEFNAIQTAINSKADTNSPALAGTPTAPTASTTTSTTQIATTAFVQQEITANVTTAIIVNAIYPVGSIYVNATNATNPGTLLGVGTWVAFGSGRVMVGLDSGDTDFDTAEETGGSKTHTLTVDEMPAHTHDYTRFSPQSPYTQTNSLVDASGSYQSNTTESTGGGQAHNNVQPYVVVHMWKRTA